MRQKLPDVPSRMGGAAGYETSPDSYIKIKNRGSLPLALLASGSDPSNVRQKMMELAKRLM